MIIYRHLPCGCGVTATRAAALCARGIHHCWDVKHEHYTEAEATENEMSWHGSARPLRKPVQA